MSEDSTCDDGVQVLMYELIIHQYVVQPATTQAKATKRENVLNAHTVANMGISPHVYRVNPYSAGRTLDLLYQEMCLRGTSGRKGGGGLNVRRSECSGCE